MQQFFSKPIMICCRSHELQHKSLKDIPRKKFQINQLSRACAEPYPRMLFFPGGTEGGLLEGVTTLDCLVDLDLKDNHLTGERARMLYEYDVRV